MEMRIEGPGLSPEERTVLQENFFRGTLRGLLRRGRVTGEEYDSLTALRRGR